VVRISPHSAGGAVEAYALVGMAAMIAATVHAPVMATVLVFELSGDYAIALPLLTATAIATLVSRRVHRESIYTEELRRRGRKWQVKVVGEDESP
jgi:CIC family chloride channel protein